MHQILLGAAFPFLFVAGMYAARRARASLAMLVLGPAAVLLGALWSILPDLPRLLGMNDLYFKMARDPRTDIFFWHYTIDCIEQDASGYLLGILFIAASFVAAAWREVRKLEQ